MRVVTFPKWEESCEPIRVPTRPGFWTQASGWYTLFTYGLAGVLADNAAKPYRDRAASDTRAAIGLLDREYTMALEVFDRGNRWIANRSSAHRSWVLRLDCARTAEPPGQMVAGNDRACARIHV